jgi:hypothetical protein
MQREPLVSGTVVAAGYDAAKQVLELEFKSGRVYQFDGVPAGVYQWLLRTPEKGAYVSRMINGRYAYRDVTPALGPAGDLEAILRASLRQLEPEQP